MLRFVRSVRVWLVVLIGTAALAPSPAAAQIDPPIMDPLGAVDAWATAESLRRMLPDSSQAGREARKPPKARAKEKPPTRRQLAKLRFKRDSDVTQANNQAVVDLLGPEYDPAVVVADLERNRGLVHDMMRGFDGHWSPRNLADVAATALLGGYAAYHGKDQLSSRGSLAVRKAARAGLARSKRIRTLSAARKQTGAEMTEIRFIYRLTALNAARMAGDSTDLDIARYQIRTWIRDVYSLDVDAVKLTKRGVKTG